jgi:hypothetical protein
MRFIYCLQLMSMLPISSPSIDTHALHALFIDRASTFGIELDASALEELSNSFRNITANVLASANTFLKPPVHLDSAFTTDPTERVIQSAEILAALVPFHSATASVRKETAYEGSYVLSAKGDGGCLFTSLRLTVEIEAAMKLALRILDGDDTPKTLLPSILLNGSDQTILAEGAYIRKVIVEWFNEKNLQKEVAPMGEFEQGGRAWTRADILNTELVKRTSTVNIDMKNVRTRYLNEMLLPTTWGSVPEWVAFSMLRRIPVVAYAWDAALSKLRTIDSAHGPVQNDDALKDAMWPPLPHSRTIQAPTYNQSDYDDLSVYSDKCNKDDDMSIISINSLSDDSENDLTDDDDIQIVDQTINNADDKPLSACVSNDVTSSGSCSWTSIARILFSGGNHYDCILTSYEYFTLRAVFGNDALKHAIPVSQYFSGMTITRK